MTALARRFDRVLLSESEPNPWRKFPLAVQPLAQALWILLREEAERARQKRIGSNVPVRSAEGAGS